ncbi:hypothetical protein JCM11251_003224 [Rhodosporidiobolus azoricus]
MSYVEEPAPHFSFTATPVTELDIEALLDMWDDPSPVVGFSLPPIDSHSTFPEKAPLSPIESVLSPTCLCPSPQRIPRSHSLLNLRSAARGSIASSAGSGSTDSSSPSPPFPTTPTFPYTHPTTLFLTHASSAVKASHLYSDLKPLPPIQLRPTSVLPPSPSAPEDLLGLEDLFGPPRANPFPSVSRTGSVSSGSATSPTSPPSSAAVFPSSATPRRGSAFSADSSSTSSTTSSSSASSATPTRTPSLRFRASTFAARLERFEAPLPLPRGPATTAFDPSQGGTAAFTAPRAAPAPTPGAVPAGVERQQYPRASGEVLRERQVLSYPRMRPEKGEKKGKREREVSTASSGSGGGGGMLSRWL